METIPENKNVTLFIGPEQISNGSTPLEDITTALDVDEDLKVRVQSFLRYSGFQKNVAITRDKNFQSGGYMKFSSGLKNFTKRSY